MKSFTVGRKTREQEKKRKNYPVLTLKMSSFSPTVNWHWKWRQNFSSMTDSVPFFSARLIRFNCMFLLIKRLCTHVSIIFNHRNNNHACYENSIEQMMIWKLLQQLLLHHHLDLPEMNRKMTCALMIFHGSGIVQYLPTRFTRFVRLVILQQSIRLCFGYDGNFDLRWRHMNIESTTDQ